MKSRLIWSVCALSILVTGCIKSDQPVRYEGGLVRTVSSTALSRAAFHRDSETQELKRVVQLRTDSSGTYLYNCTPGNDIEKIRAEVYAVRNQPNTFVMSLEEGNFFFSGSNSGHEVFVLQPHGNFLAWWKIDTGTSQVAEDFFDNFQPISPGSKTYPSYVLQGFLYEHADDFIAEKGLSGFRFVDGEGDMTSCAFMNQN